MGETTIRKNSNGIVSVYTSMGPDTPDKKS